MPALPALLLALLCTAETEAAIDPTESPVLVETLQRWTFDDGTQGWNAEHQCALSVAGGLLKVRCDGNDPYFHCSLDQPGGGLMVKIKARSQTAGDGQVFWTSSEAPHRSPRQAAGFSIQHDGQWHEYTARFRVPGRLANLRIDPGMAAGPVEIDSIELLSVEPHPLVIERIDVLEDRVRVAVKNRGQSELAFTLFAAEHTAGGNQTVEVELPTDAARPLQPLSIEITSADLPPIRRTIFLHHPAAQTDWITRPLGESTLQVSPDGTMARIRRDGRLAAVLGPTVHCDGTLPAMKLVDDGPTLRFEGDGVTLHLAPKGNELTLSIASNRPCEGPVVRAVGDMKQGLFAGLEYLVAGERSSSKLDVETAEHVRFAPDPMKVTMPLMAVVSDRASVAVSWDDMSLQPVFAVPNFFDCTNESRMALRGKQIKATVRVDGGTLEDCIVWAVGRKGLPPLPEPPRTPQQQRDLCLKALNGPLKNENGWGHCVESRWQRRPYADVASTLWRLTGEVPELPELVPNGSHVRNEAIYFVTGRAQQWLDRKSREAQRLIETQQDDGSYRYDGKYARGHFENTASGVCAQPAARLLEFAWITGDEPSLQAGLRTLDYMKRFRTPRGAQVWEVPLHTPDQLAAAYLVWAYVRGYELTGNKEHLAQARKWAISGIPFVYLWGNQPIMLYATVPVYGATNWVAPNWIGMPVQWVGGVYAYALTKLAPHDDSFDFNHLARGILISAEQQQYPDGEYVGLLPDAIQLADQRRRPWTINPCALVSLRLVLDGELDFLSVAAEGQHRVAAPFPVTIRDGKAHIQGRAGVAYQVLIDGRRIVDVNSQGDDVVPLK